MLFAVVAVEPDTRINYHHYHCDVDTRLVALMRPRILVEESLSGHREVLREELVHVEQSSAVAMQWLGMDPCQYEWQREYWRPVQHCCV